MISDDLRAELRSILALEAAADVDWPSVEQRCLALVRDFVPESRDDGIVLHFLDDPDIRRKDRGYAGRQREKLSRYLSEN